MEKSEVYFRTGEKHLIELETGYIRLIVIDEDGELVKNTNYKIYDLDENEIFSGKTDEEGKIQYDWVNYCDYKLNVENYIVYFPSIANQQEWISVIIPILGQIKISLIFEDEDNNKNNDFRIYDLYGNLVAEEIYQVNDEIIVPCTLLGDYIFNIGNFSTIVYSQICKHTTMLVNIPALGLLNIHLLTQKIKPFPNKRVVIKYKRNTVFDGLTDEHGKILVECVVFGDYECNIDNKTYIVPATRTNELTSKIYC